MARPWFFPAKGEANMASTSIRSHRADEGAIPMPAFEMVSGAIAAWSDLNRDFTQLVASSAAAQTKAFADLWAAGLSGFKVWPSQQELLMFVENQAEQMADGVRHTIQDLQAQGGEPTPPLPD
jgi:hypothetical protein